MLKDLRVDIDELRKLVLEIDEEMRKERIPVEDRSVRLRGRLSNRLGSWSLYETPEQKAAAEILETLYPPGALAFKHTFTGAFLYKDAIYPLGIGTVFGNVRIKLENLIVGLPPERWRQLKGDPAAYGAFIDQCCDVADLSQGLDDRRKMYPEAPGHARLEAGVGHLQTASEAATSQAASDGIMHAVFLAGEILLKGALMAAGVPDKKLRSIGHKAAALITELCEAYPNADGETLRRALGFLPKSVSERYEHQAYSTEAIGVGIMATQFIGGEVFRLLTGRDLRSSIKLDGSPYRPERVFP